jgi:Ca2+-dependent lipid-binding protein|eukprot:COSAG06_NODE_3495_length_5266_cov_32.400813_2_plen_137_part_00
MRCSFSLAVHVLSQNLNPHYDETFAFKMPRHCCVDELHIEVFDWNQLSKSTSLGETTLDLRSVFDDGWHVASRGQYPLQRSANSPPKSSTKKMSFRRSSSTQSNESEDDPEDRGGPGEVGLRLKFVPDLPLSLDSD